MLLFALFAHSPSACCSSSRSRFSFFVLWVLTRLFIIMFCFLKFLVLWLFCLVLTGHRSGAMHLVAFSEPYSMNGAGFQSSGGGRPSLLQSYILFGGLGSPESSSF